MILAITLSTGLAVAVLAVFSWQMWRRASRARSQLQIALHDKALALDTRCDHLQQQSDKVATRAQIGTIMDLIDQSEREGLLAPDAPQRLRRFALDLLDEVD